MERSRSAFTIIELLVAVSLVLVVAALISSALPRVWKDTEAMKALNQIRQLGLMAGLYAGDNNGRFPASQHQDESWMFGLAPYFGLPDDPSVAQLRRYYLSPGDPSRLRITSYAINDFLTASPYGAQNLNCSRPANIPAASETILFTETSDAYEGSDHFHFASSGFLPALFLGQVAARRYRDRGVYSFADGRAEIVSWKDAQARLNKVGSHFVHPLGQPSQTMAGE